MVGSRIRLLFKSDLFKSSLFSSLKIRLSDQSAKVFVFLVASVVSSRLVIEIFSPEVRIGFNYDARIFRIGRSFLSFGLYCSVAKVFLTLFTLLRIDSFTNNVVAVLRLSSFSCNVLRCVCVCENITLLLKKSIGLPTLFK